VENAVDAVDAPPGLRVGARGTGSAVARPVPAYLNFAAIVEDGARTLVVELHREALEELIADESGNVVEALDPAHQRVEVDGGEDLPLDGDAAEFEPVDARHADVLLAVSGTAAAQRAIRPDADLRERLRQQLR
jgi:hypothetical protein